MKKIHIVLIILLAIQVFVFAAGLVFTGASQENDPDKPLLPLKTHAFDMIEIQDQNTALKIKKDGDKWLLPDDHQFPASQDKIKNLIKEISEIKQSWPVGQTMLAAKKFKNTDEAFEKKLILI
ncbi:MAG: hypothetical protein HQM16_19470 [Deltaproteobacteria bacterium]|nr:hypothetical protein [Deltaproteobacteria bacterium]